MKSFLFSDRATRLFLLATLFLLSTHVTTLHAQAKLSIQGILKKIDGTALADGSYNLKFRIYADSLAGAALWTEIQEVELNGGVYSAVLGTINPLNVPFDQPYYVGVTIGTAAEMLPRISLTSAPYALSLIGQNNKFPSIGTVRADNQIVVDKLAVGQGALPATASLEVGGGVLARGGAPGAFGANNNGYAFGGSGDNDSGLFSLNDNSISLFANSTERIQINDNGASITGNATVSGNVALNGSGHLVYNGVDDWRLVYRNDFENGTEGWSAYLDVNNPLQAGTVATTENPTILGVPYTAGKVIKPTLSQSRLAILKRQYDLTAFPHSHIRVRFTYHHIDTWDGNEDRGWAGISHSLTEKPLVGWYQPFQAFDIYGQTNMSYLGNSGNDFGRSVEMTFKYPGNIFYLFIGANLNGVQDEDYAIDNVEIWVR